MNKLFKYEEDGFYFDINLTYSRRKTLSIRLKHCETTVYVSSPMSISYLEIVGYIRQKREWIAKNIVKMSAIVKKSRSFANGSKHLLLGNEITLRLCQGAKKSFSFDGTTLTITARGECDENRAYKLMYEWYSLQAEQLLPKIVSPIISSFALKYKVMPSRVEYKYITSYWGQCTGRTRLIRLNIELVRARREAIEMIVFHELCHLIHQNHSSRFYSLLSEVFASWKIEVDYLKDNISLKI